MVIKNIRKLYVSMITSEVAGVPTYGPMAYIPGLREISVTPNSEKGECYAEGTLWETDTNFSKVDVSINLADIAPADYIKLFGANEATGGGFIDNASDEAPYIAIHYEKVLSGGVIEYGTLLKGKLVKPEDKVATAEGSPNYQYKSVSGTFMAIGNGMWRNVVRSNDAGFTETAAFGDTKQFTLPTVKTGA